VPVVPIPGTKRVKWLEQNAAALGITLTDVELAQLDPLGARGQCPVLSLPRPRPLGPRRAAGEVSLNL
jgi:diketogulonate reductase-like aldo/keto reductase